MKKNKTRKKLVSEMNGLFQEIYTLQQEINLLSDHVRDKQNDRLENLYEESEATWEILLEETSSILSNTITNRFVMLSNLIEQGGIRIASWHDNQWASLESSDFQHPPKCIRVGELIVDNFNDSPNLPAIAQFLTHCNLFIFSPDSLIQTRIKTINSILWRIISHSSPQTYQCTLIDSPGLGRNFSSLLNLPEKIRGIKVYCQAREIQEKLQIILDQITDIIQNKLKDKYANIEEYNQENTRLLIPYQFVGISDFPHGFNDESIEILKAISRTGNKAGVYIIGGLLTNPEEFNFSTYETLLENGTLINIINQDEAEWDDSLLANYKVKLDSPPSSLLIELISDLISESLLSISDILYIPEILLPVDNWWLLESTHELRFPIGIHENQDVLNIILGQETEAFHMLVGGRTRSGKSNFLHLLILGLCTNYSPEELDLYLVDFKDGVEFQDYVRYNLPHAKAIIIEAEREYGVSVLEYLDREMERRSRVFKESNINAVNIQQYRDITGNTLPRALVIIDEFVKLFEYDDHLSDLAHSYLLRIAQRGGAFGIHLVLAAQRPVGVYQRLNDILSQISQRIAFKCNDPSDSALILGESNEKAAYLERAGIACVTSDPNIIRETKTVNVGLVTNEDRELYLEGLIKLSEKSPIKTKKETTIFRKYEPAFWKNYPEVTSCLATEAVRTELIYPTIWLGEPVSISSKFSFPLHPEETQNILLINSEEDIAQNFLLNTFLSLLLSTSPDTTDYYFFCKDIKTEKILSYLKMLNHAFPECFFWEEIDSNEETIQEIYERLQSRETNNSYEKKTFLIIYGLHRIKYFHGPDQYTPAIAGETLAKIIQYGPSVGIHTIIWANKSTELFDTTGSRQILDEFCHRLVSHVTSDESNSILNSPIASNLESNLNRIYYRDQRWPERQLEKVKLFSKPAIDDYNKLLLEIKKYWSKSNA